MTERPQSTGAEEPQRRPDGDGPVGRPPPGPISGLEHRDRWIRGNLLFRAEEVVQYAVVLALLALAGVILVRTFIQFFTREGGYPETVIGAIDGVLAVIIVLDILRTMLAHFAGSDFPVRPFLFIGILAAVREVLSASFHLALQGNLTATDFDHSVIKLGAGVGVVLVLVFALLLLHWSRGDEVV